MLGRYLKRDDSHEFKPIMAEIEEEPVNPLGGIAFWIVIAAMVFLVLWMCFGKVDVVVSARGTVIPEGDIKILQPLDTGIVSAILCREGDFVKKKQPLIEIDPSITEPELESKQKNLQYLDLEKKRIGSMLGKEAFLTGNNAYDTESVRIQKELYLALTASIEKQMETKKAELGRIEEERLGAENVKSHYETLFTIADEKEKRLRAVKDIISGDDYEKAQNDVLTYGNNIRQTDNKIKQLAFEKSRVESEIETIKEEFRVNALKEYSDKKKQSTEIESEIDKNSFRNEKQKIVSPVDGYVTNLYVHTVGGVVTPAQKLLAIVPAGTPLVIKAIVLNKDIGFVKEGMPVSVKIDAFDFQKYGILKGVVKNVSRHSIDDEKLGQVYEIFIMPEETDLQVEGKRIPVGSGMTVTAEIKVEQRKIIEFFIYPIIKYLDEGLSVK
jgi:hemolysin D